MFGLMIEDHVLLCSSLKIHDYLVCKSNSLEEVQVAQSSKEFQHEV